MMSTNLCADRTNREVDSIQRGLNSFATIPSSIGIVVVVLYLYTSRSRMRCSRNANGNDYYDCRGIEMGNVTVLGRSVSQ